MKSDEEASDSEEEENEVYLEDIEQSQESVSIVVPNVPDWVEPNATEASVNQNELLASSSSMYSFPHSSSVTYPQYNDNHYYDGN